MCGERGAAPQVGRHQLVAFGDGERPSQIASILTSREADSPRRQMPGNEARLPGGASGLDAAAKVRRPAATEEFSLARPYLPPSQECRQRPLR